MKHPSFLRRGKLTHLAVLGAIAALPAIAQAQELVKDAIPGRWVEQYLPEDLTALQHPGYFNDLDKARSEVFHGRYKTALITLLNVKNADAEQVALIKAPALSAVGRKDEAIELLSDKAIADRPKVQMLRARVLSDMGKLDEAASLLKTVVEKNADSLPARYYLGEISERLGDLTTAKAEYEWIFKNYYDRWQGQGPRNFEDAELVTLMGRAFDRHATLTGAYANNAALHNQVLKVFVQAYDIIDREYWPARIAAAQFHASREDDKEATKELSLALEANPNDITAHAILGGIALSTWNFDAADGQIAMIRAVDSTSPVADILECRNLLQQRRPKEAEVPARRVLARQPKNIEAMGLLAGACALQLKDDEVKQLLADVEKIDPNNASAYLDLADQLSAMRQYPRAEAMYRIAIKRAPWWTAARNGLGLLLTQSGDEDKAKIELDAAYAIDPFNYRTTNYSILLDKMARMSRKESDHFVIIYDEKNDPVIGEYFNEYMESIHKDVCGVFKHEPAVKTYIEVFPAHDAFSARITGSPWIGTVGASTGRVIALCTPRRGENTMGPYNWAQVLRHEYTHTVTLSATDNRIGHWMTEGLAVYEERIPLRWEWVPMLYNAVKKKELFNMEKLTWAFVRPKRPQDRSLAYAESYWICKYIEEKWGHESILRMMAEFRNGRTQEDVFKSVLGVGTESFFTEFTGWTEKQVATWGYDEETTKKYDDLVKKAEELTQDRQDKEAAEVWEQIVKLRPMDELPHKRLAGIYLGRIANNPEKAIEHLLRLEEVSLKDDRISKRLARICMDNNDVARAEKFAMNAVYTDPYDLDAHEVLLAVAQKAGNEKNVEREKRVIPVLKQWILDYRKSQLIDGAPQP